MVELKCPNCGKLFVRKRKNSFLCIKTRIFNACSRHCAVQFQQRYLKNPNSIEVKKCLSENFVREFRSVDMEHS